MRRLLIGVVRVYQVLLSPWLGGACRFYPSCSNYAVEALSRHGAARGLMMALGRLLKCHPLHPGGVDPVPVAANERGETATRGL